MVFENNEKMVDVIDGGRIVSVTEEYARREGLPIIRRHSVAPQVQVLDKGKMPIISSREKKGLLKFEEFRKPLKGDKGVVNELKDNFHWELINLRKGRGMTRKQVAQAMNIDEYDLKMLEHGVLTKEDYVLVNKVEDFYRISLRKDKSFSGSPLRNALTGKSEEVKKIVDKPNLNEKKNENDFVLDDVVSGDEIELDD